jgi:antitoxin HicB
LAEESKMNKTVEHYLSLPYTIELIPEPQGGWFVSVRELPGCMSQGDTPEEAIEMIQDAMRGWIEVSLEDGDTIPEPRPLEDYSGKFVVRVPRSLHQDLVETADREGISLNQYINVALARSLGRLVPASPGADEGSGWPGLKAAVRQALLAAGMDEEVGELDERVFASWADQCLGQVESAIARGDVQNALQSLEVLARGLRAGQDKSPVVAGFCRAVLLLRRQVELTIGLKPAASRDGMPHPEISPLSQRADGTLGQMVIHDEREPYAATLPEAEPRVEPLAERPDTDQRERGRGAD